MRKYIFLQKNEPLKIVSFIFVVIFLSSFPHILIGSLLFFNGSPHFHTTKPTEPIHDTHKITILLTLFLSFLTRKLFILLLHIKIRCIIVHSINTAVTCNESTKKIMKKNKPKKKKLKKKKNKGRKMNAKQRKNEK